MEKEKLKETYQNPAVKIILLEFSDIIVTSSGGNNNGEGPNIGDVGGDDWSQHSIIQTVIKMKKGNENEKLKN